MEEVEDLEETSENAEADLIAPTGLQSVPNLVTAKPKINQMVTLTRVNVLLDQTVQVGLPDAPNGVTAKLMEGEMGEVVAETEEVVEVVGEEDPMGEGVEVEERHQGTGE